MSTWLVEPDVEERVFSTENFIDTFVRGVVQSVDPVRDYYNRPFMPYTPAAASTAQGAWYTEATEAWEDTSSGSAQRANPHGIYR